DFFDQTFFLQKKFAGFQGTESLGRRPQTAKSPESEGALQGVNLKNSPVDCFSKRGRSARESVPYLAYEHTFSRRLYAATNTSTAQNHTPIALLSATLHKQVSQHLFILPTEKPLTNPQLYAIL
ncbi:MAG: hypothetical protein J5851_08005, partial [Oscillospiraceae bacterium]|nr:hypothetical protein [Oscillospiraceae bacterium]